MEYSFPKHYFVIATLIGLLLSSILIGCSEQTRLLKQKATLERYQQYYRATETLLDSLEDNFNWTDRYDSEAIDNYYDSRRELLKSLRK